MDWRKIMIKLLFETEYTTFNLEFETWEMAFEFLKNYIVWDETRLHVAKFSFKENKNDHQSL